MTDAQIRAAEQGISLEQPWSHFHTQGPCQSEGIIMAPRTTAPTSTVSALLDPILCNPGVFFPLKYKDEHVFLKFLQHQVQTLS